jgi:nucleolar pre-ribosomal-associated protein 1
MVADESLSQESREASGSCVSLLLELSPTRAEEFVAIALDRLQRLPVTFLTAELLTVGRRLHATSSSSGKPFLTALADHGIQWAVRCFAEDSEGFFFFFFLGQQFITRCSIAVRGWGTNKSS